MPTIRLTTNILKSSLPKEFTLKLAKIAADILNKPITSIIAVTTSESDIVWGGTTEPAAIVTLLKVGSFDAEANKKYSKVIFDFVTQSIGISGDRLYINFVDVAPEAIGYKGTTFAEILGK